MNRSRTLLGTKPFLSLSLLLTASLASAQTPPDRTIPARQLPTPTTVSPELQKVISTPWQGSTAPVSLTADQWKAMLKTGDEGEAKHVEALETQFHVTDEEKTMAGVHVYLVKPDVVAPQNRNRLLVNVHGGAYVSFAGKACLGEAILMAHYAQAPVLAIDYRMPPDHPFPAAVDDTIAVWKEVLKSHPARTLALFGTSAGGGLTLATVLRLKELNLPFPAAIMAGTPWADLTKTGDTYFTNEAVDNVLGSEDGFLDAATKLYAGSHDRKEPLLSPVYGDFAGFPPTVLISGTRDLFLSNTVRVHQKLLKAGVAADLLVFEAGSHAEYLVASDTPESADAFVEVAKFFDQHLAR